MERSRWRPRYSRTQSTFLSSGSSPFGTLESFTTITSPTSLDSWIIKSFFYLAGYEHSLLDFRFNMFLIVTYLTSIHFNSLIFVHCLCSINETINANINLSCRIKTFALFAKHSQINL